MSDKFNETEINKRTCADIHRSFSNNCIACKNSKLLKVEKYPTTGVCSALAETVDLFRDTCQFYEPTKTLKSLKFKHIDYLLNETPFLQ